MVCNDRGTVMFYQHGNWGLHSPSFLASLGTWLKAPFGRRKHQASCTCNLNFWFLLFLLVDTGLPMSPLWAEFTVFVQREWSSSSAEKTWGEKNILFIVDTMYMTWGIIVFCFALFLFYFTLFYLCSDTGNCVPAGNTASPNHPGWLPIKT